VKSRSPLEGKKEVLDVQKSHNLADNFRKSMTREIDVQKIKNEAELSHRNLNSDRRSSVNDSKLLPDIFQGASKTSRSSKNRKFSKKTFPNFGNFARTSSNFKKSFNMKMNPAMELRQGYKEGLKLKMKSSRTKIVVTKPPKSSSKVTSPAGN
jgi:hypothetical protein